MIDQAVAKLRAGEAVGLPTETVYGLAADIRQPEAIKKIFTLKERPFFDPLIVHISRLEQIPMVASKFSPLAKKLADAFWPGPLTLVLPKNENLNPVITASHNTVGVRMPRHPLTLQIIDALGAPVAAPSANKFGHTSPTTAEHVRAAFAAEQVYVVDGGACEVGVESTVAEIVDNKIVVYRPGGITNEQLWKFAEVIQLKSPVSPGHLENHYQPRLPLVWIRGARHITPEQYSNVRIKLGHRALHPCWIHLDENPVIAARTVYAHLQAADKMLKNNVIFLTTAERNPAIVTNDLWVAIEDRLEKAKTILA